MREKLFSVTSKDFRVDTFRSGGKGGQNQNKRDTGVRITHVESGAVGESREHRTQGANRTAAFNRLLESPRWRSWFNLRVAEELQRESVEERVERMLREDSVVVEGRVDGRWTRLEDEA